MRTTKSLPGASHAAEVSGAGLPSLDLDDGSGVRVAHSSFHGHRKFSWDLFRGFESCRVLTYSIDLRTVRRLFADLGVAKIECVIGTLATIDRIEKVLAAQQAAISSAAVIVTELCNAGGDVVAELASGRLAFRVLKDQVSHTKLYLLAGGTQPATRVIIGSANFSEQAFSGRQHETLAMYDDDSAAWAFYQSMYREVRDMASQEIDPALLTARDRPVDIQDAPLLADDSPSVLIVGDGSASETDEERASIDVPRRAARGVHGQEPLQGGGPRRHHPPRQALPDVLRRHHSQTDGQHRQGLHQGREPAGPSGVPGSRHLHEPP